MGEENPMEHLENTLQRALYRATCPDPVALGEYHLGQLPPEEAEVIRQHLKECHHCVHELRALEQYFRDLAPETEYTLGEKARIWVAKRLPQGGHTGNTGVLAQSFAVRAKKQEDLQRYTFGESGELAIESRADPHHPGRKVLLGLLMGLESVKPGEITASLLRAGELAASSEVDEFGNFTIPGLEPENYDLVLQSKQVEIHIPEVQV